MQNSDETRLYAGASRTCITPEADLFPIEHFRNNMKAGEPSIFSGKILEDIFFRILIVENKANRFVFAVMDLPGVPESKEMTQLIADCSGVDVSNVMCTATHNHSGLYADNPEFEKWWGEEFTRKIKIYRKYLRNVIPDAVKAAKENLQPAKMGLIKSSCYLNVNRNEKNLGAQTDTYGFRIDGPADRDLYLLRFDNEEGNPIALLYNFAVHACMMIHNDPEGLGTEISGDLPGRVCRLIEKSWDDKAVAIFTSGAAGDLNPIMMSRVNIIEEKGKIVTKDLGRAGEHILEFMGRRLVWDVLNANSRLKCDIDHAILWAEKRYFNVSPEAVVKPGNHDEVEFQIGLMMIGNLAVVATNGEIFNEIGQRLKKNSPFKNTLMITHAGEWTAYVKDDSGQGEYETELRKTVEDMMNNFSAGGNLCD